MPCRSPLPVYRDHFGRTTIKRPAVQYTMYNVPCGGCRDCRLTKAREWAIRCYHEQQFHAETWMLDLTFETNPLTIAKSDLQGFVKNLRNAREDRTYKYPNLRYFGVGEYGSKFSRPHYHVIVFGLQPRNPYYWRRSKNGTLLYRDEDIEQRWGKGFVTLSKFDTKGAAYAARYTMKKQTGEKSKDHYVHQVLDPKTGELLKEIQIQPEFQLSSRNPAIGRDWIEKYWEETFNNGYVMFKGKKVAIPRYYFTWLAAAHPLVHQKVMAERFEHVPERETADRMKNAAKARDARTRTLKRNYEEGSHA